MGVAICSVFGYVLNDGHARDVDSGSIRKIGFITYKAIDSVVSDQIKSFDVHSVFHRIKDAHGLFQFSTCKRI